MAGLIQKMLGVIGITGGLIEIADFFYTHFLKKQEDKPEVGTQVQYLANANGDHRPVISVNGSCSCSSSPGSCSSCSELLENCIHIRAPLPEQTNTQLKYEVSITVTRNESPKSGEYPRVVCQSSEMTQSSPKVSRMVDDSISSFVKEITRGEIAIGYVEQDEEYYYLLNPFN